jgi:hypothetical protein
VRKLAPVAVCLALAACAGPGPIQSDWERAQEAKNWHEEHIALPPYPKRGDLVEFDAGPGTDFRFFVDSTSLSVGADGVVRYVLVARSPQGAENVSFEGLHCGDAEYKVYATGRSDRRWVAARGARWRPVAERAGPWRRTLADDYFCPGKSPILSAAEGIEALKRGGNPRAATLRDQPGG